MSDARFTIQPAAALAPRPGAIEQVRQRAAEIRRHRVRTAVTTVGVSAVLVTALAWHPSTTFHSIRPTQVPPPSRSPRPTSSDAPRPVAQGPVAPEVRESVQVPSPEVTASARPGPAPVPTYTELTYPDPWYSAMEATEFGPPVTPPEAWVCSTVSDWSPGPEGWCVKQHNSPPSGDPDRWFFGITVCRLPGSSDGTFTNDHLPRLRIWDTADDSVVFDSQQRPWPSLGAAKPSRVWQVAERACVMFFSPWDSIDNEGNSVEGGTYRYDWDPTDADFDAWAATHTGDVIEVPDE